MRTKAPLPPLLTDFSFLASVVADASGAFQFLDNEAGSFKKRFYRLSLP